MVLPGLLGDNGSREALRGFVGKKVTSFHVYQCLAKAREPGLAAKEVRLAWKEVSKAEQMAYKDVASTLKSGEWPFPPATETSLGAPPATIGGGSETQGEAPRLYECGESSEEEPLRGAQEHGGKWVAKARKDVDKARTEEAGLGGLVLKRDRNAGQEAAETRAPAEDSDEDLEAMQVHSAGKNGGKPQAREKVLIDLTQDTPTTATISATNGRCIYGGYKARQTVCVAEEIRGQIRGTLQVVLSSGESGETLRQEEGALLRHDSLGLGGYLELSNNLIGSVEASVLARQPSLVAWLGRGRSSSIAIADAETTEFTDRSLSVGVVGICRAVVRHRLFVLELSRVGLGDLDAANLLRACSGCPSLTKLDVSFNSITGKGCSALRHFHRSSVEPPPTSSGEELPSSPTSAAGPRNQLLTSLSLGGNPIGYEGCEHVADLLSDCSTLTWLDVHRCEIDDAAALVLERALNSNGVLYTLDIRDNKLADEGVQTIKRVLQSTKSLQHVDLKGNPFSPIAATTLLESEPIHTLDERSSEFCAVGVYI